MGMLMHGAVLQFLAWARFLLCTLQAKPKSDGESAVSTKVSLLQQCLCCTTFQSIWQPSVDRVLPSAAQRTQDQDDSAGGAAARSGGSSIVSEGGRTWGCMCTVVCTEMPGQPDRLQVTWCWERGRQWTGRSVDWNGVAWRGSLLFLCSFISGSFWKHRSCSLFIKPSNTTM